MPGELFFYCNVWKLSANCYLCIRNKYAAMPAFDLKRLQSIISVMDMMLFFALLLGNYLQIAIFAVEIMMPTIGFVVCKLWRTPYRMAPSFLLPGAKRGAGAPSVHFFAPTFGIYLQIAIFAVEIMMPTIGFIGSKLWRTPFL